jgi:hypothetical protein
MSKVKHLLLLNALLFLNVPSSGHVTCTETANPDTLAWFTALTDKSNTSTYYNLPWFDKNTTPIRIDGNLTVDVWTNSRFHGEIDMTNCTYYSAADMGLPSGVVSWTGPADLAGKWLFAYGDDAIYVAFDRTDDVYVNDLGTAYWSRDYFEMMIDPAATNIRKKIPGTVDCIPGGPTMNGALSIFVCDVR